MAVYVPNSVIFGEAQQTVSRESIRRIVQGQKNTAGSAAEAQVLLDSAIAAGVSSVVGFEVIRTDLGVKQYWDGSAWVRLGGQDQLVGFGAEEVGPILLVGRQAVIDDVTLVVVEQATHHVLSHAPHPTGSPRQTAGPVWTTTGDVQGPPRT